MLKTRLAIVLTVVNVGAAIVALVCLGYIAGLTDGRGHTKHPSKPIASRTVLPNPHVGAGQHPAFDCSRLAHPLGAPKDGLLDLETVAENRKRYEGKVVNVRGVVVQAYREIMGTNWFHVCDRPSGEVLVVSGKAWAAPGSEVEVTGTLSLNRNIGNAYVFPLFIEDGRLDGESVEPARLDTPEPIRYL